MYITIKISAETVQNLHKRSLSTPELMELLKIEKEFGIIMEPLHPFSNDFRLDPYFVVRVPKGIDAEEIIARFRQCEMVEAVYIKPPDEMP